MTFEKKYVENEKDRLNNLKHPTHNIRLDEETWTILSRWGSVLNEKQRGTVIKKLLKFADDVALGENPLLSYARLFKNKQEIEDIERVVQTTKKAESATEK